MGSHGGMERLHHDIIVVFRSIENKLILLYDVYLSTWAWRCDASELARFTVELIKNESGVIPQCIASKIAKAGKSQ